MRENGICWGKIVKYSFYRIYNLVKWGYGFFFLDVMNDKYLKKFFWFLIGIVY